MIQVDVRYLGGVRFESDARGHRTLCDQPITNGGTDTGMTPPEFLLAALGTCAGYYAAEYLKARGIAADGLAVRVEALKAANPARLSSFQIDLTMPPLESRHEEGVLRAVKKCLIHNTLLSAPCIDIRINGAGAPAVAA
ncbi:MAG TPA: OsmC family protein [Bryobacteraceae bacterium]|nr:OsmC family protein [Bryobacteraceae bacterium]